MKMTKITIPAAAAHQGSLLLYVTALKVRNLISKGFYNVETLDPEVEDKGYQRLLNKTRAKKLADYIVKGQDSKDAFLPTSIFLATDKVVDYNPESSLLTIDVEHIGAFSVVDGQHRLEGLRMAAEKDERVLDFEVPVNIASGLSKIAQMCHFLIVNTTQKSVDKAVEQRIYARLTDSLEIEDMPNLPKWILNTVEKGEVEKAVKFSDFLNDTDDSPWKSKIQMANAEGSGYINQRSFVKALVKYVFTSSNPLTSIRDNDKEMKIFLNYWKAISNIFNDERATVLYKYNGVELFCKFSSVFIVKLFDKKNFTVATMEKLLRDCFDNMDGEFAGVGHSEFWIPGGKASQMNAGALNAVYHEMSRALHAASMNGSIEI